MEGIKMLFVVAFLVHKTVFVLATTTSSPPECYTDVPGYHLITCADKYATIPGHIFCLDDISRRPLTREEQTEIESKHNNIRSAVNPPAANMMTMTYNEGLGRTAQMWAEACQLTQSKPIQRFRPGSYAVGENIYVSSTNMTWTDVISVWEAEKINFTYGSDQNDPKLVSNYTQMIWSDSSAVGCSMKNCQGKYFYVCNYAPSMDSTNVSQPYSRGDKSCSMCPLNCTKDHLCDCHGVICLNGGVVDYKTCTCNCIKEVSTYEIPVCDLQCKPNGDDPACGNVYNVSSCRSDFQTMFHCPWMCDLCPYAGKNYTEHSSPLPWARNRTKCPPTTMAMSTTTASTPGVYIWKQDVSSTAIINGITTKQSGPTTKQSGSTTKQSGPSTKQSGSQSMEGGGGGTASIELASVWIVSMSSLYSLLVGFIYVL